MEARANRTFRIRRSHLFMGSISLMVLFGLLGCGDDSTPATGGATAAASGVVQSFVGSHSKGKLGVNPLARRKHIQLETNSCAGTTCSTVVVGSGGTAGPSCSVDGNANFTIASVPVGQQLEATFNCGASGSQSCIVMAGDAGVSCDPVADAVIKAFLSVMGISSLTDASLAHANIAQIAHSIDQAALTGTTAADTFLNAVAACSTSACYLAAIKASPFYGPFRLMRTQVTGWDVESIYTLLADVMGYQIQVDSMTFTPFGTHIDTWLSTDFIAQTRAFVAAMLADQTAHGNTYVTEIVCQMFYNKYQSGGVITYPPSLVLTNGINVPSCEEIAPTSASPLEQNGLNSSQIGQINTAISSGGGGGGRGGGGQINIGTGSCTDPNNTLAFCVNMPQMVIMTKASEPNRNDPLGTNNNNFIQSTNISMINVFPAVQTLISTVTPPTDPTDGPNKNLTCMTLAGGGPNVYDDDFCNNWFGGIITPLKNDFAGVIGLYLTLKNNSLGSNNLLSLNDLYTMFSSTSFLGMKLTDQSNFTWGVQYNQVGGGTNFLSSLLNDPNPSGTSGAFTLDPTFLNSDPLSAISNGAATSLYTGATFGFNDSFQMFTTIPTSSNIHDFVFKSAYHVDYNPTGNSTYYAAGGTATPSANTGGATADPIFCKMTDAGAPVEEDMASNPNAIVTCGDAATLGVGVDITGKIVTVPDNFAYPYTLSQWGFQGASAGSVFALVDWKTGFQIRPNGNPQLVYQMSSGNPNDPVSTLPVCTGSSGDTSKVVGAYLSMSNGSQMVSQRVTAFCLDMTSLQTNGQLGFYFAGNAQISQNNPSCPTCTMGVGLVGGITQANNFNSPQVCVYAPANALTITNGVATVHSGGGVTIAGGAITSLGDMVVDYCSKSSSYAGDTSYGLISVNGWGASSDSTLFAELLPAGSGAAPLLSAAFPSDGTPFDPSTFYLKVDAGRLNTAFGLVTQTPAATTTPQVAPTVAPHQVLGIQLVNLSWETKFDPFCDDIDGTGVCHCTDGTTSAPKSGSDCTLEDVPTDPTMSNPPYFVNFGSTPTLAKAFFTSYQGLAGAQLVDAANAGLSWNSQNWTGSGGVSGPSIQSLGINLQQALVCQFHATGDPATVYRHPTQMSNNWSHNQGGCPDSGGTITAFNCNVDCGSGMSAATGGGPIRVVYPVPMNNAYAVLTPNAAVKVANYATKDTGQGITIDPTQKLFTFDTGLALMAFRTQFPLTGITVTSGGNAVPGGLGVYQRMNNPAVDPNGNNNLDPVSSVLCYLSNSGESCTASHASKGPGLVSSISKLFSHISHH